MRIKLDESLPISLVHRLGDRNIDADSVISEGLGAAPDTEVLEAARATDRLLITLDRGFGDIRRYPPGTHAGILVLRLDNQSAAAVIAAVEQLVDQYELQELMGTVVVMHRGLLRIRRA